jgi:hypothetical protein
MDKELYDKIRQYILDTVRKYHGKKRYKPMELEKEVVEVFSEYNITRRDVKGVIRDIVDAGELIYGYAGSSFLTIPEDRENT